MNGLFAQLERAHAAASRPYLALAREYGMRSVQQLRAFEAIARADKRKPPRVSDICLQIGLPVTSSTSVFDVLEGLGYIRRMGVRYGERGLTPRTDRRETWLSLTARGMEIAPYVLSSMEAIDDFLRGLLANDLTVKGLLNMLDTISQVKGEVLER